MCAKRHERTSARSSAVQILYTSEIQGKPASLLLEEGACLSEEGAIPEYAIKLVHGYEAHQIEINKHLEATSENWSVHRMPILDRSILRIAVFEMIYAEDVPISVTINEAVELAKAFGGEDESPRFVNGVLGRIARVLTGEDVEVEVDFDDEPAAEELAEEPAAEEAAE